MRLLQGLTLFSARRYDAALEELLIRAKGSPNDAGVHFLIAEVYRAHGMWDAWEKESETGITLAGHPEQAALLANAYRQGGYRGSLQKLRKIIEASSSQRYVSPLDLAHIDGALQLPDDTMRELERAYEQRSPEIVFLQSDFTYDFLHRDPRYIALVKKVGLPAAN